MRVIPISQSECEELLKRESLGRIGCAFENQPYVVPICFSYEPPNHIYIFSTFGKKIEWMRQNPKVCLEVDEVANRSNWSSVVVEGNYLELEEPQYSTQKQHAMGKLEEYSLWWKTPLAQRRETIEDLSIKPVFFCIDVVSMTGLRAIADPL